MNDLLNDGVMELHYQNRHNSEWNRNSREDSIQHHYPNCAILEDIWLPEKSRGHKGKNVYSSTTSRADSGQDLHGAPRLWNWGRWGADRYPKFCSMFREKRSAISLGTRPKMFLQDPSENNGLIEYRRRQDAHWHWNWIPATEKSNLLCIIITHCFWLHDHDGWMTQNEWPFSNCMTHNINTYLTNTKDYLPEHNSAKMIYTSWLCDDLSTTYLWPFLKTESCNESCMIILFLRTRWTFCNRN